MGKKYVPPPNSKKNNNIFSKIMAIIKDAFMRVDPKFRPSLIFKILIIMPIVFFIYLFLFGFLFQFIFGDPSNGFGIFLGQTGLMILTLVLTFLAALFLPYSLYWYERSYFNRLFSGMFFIGGFFKIILRRLMLSLGTVLLAGVLSPLMGILTWRNFKRENKTIIKVEL